MDRVIEKEGRSRKQWLLLAAGALGILFIVWHLVARASSSRLRVDTSRLTTAVVEKGQFSEYYSFDGTVEHAITNLLDVEQGGRVEEVLVESGQMVKKGDLLLRF